MNSFFVISVHFGPGGKMRKAMTTDMSQIGTGRKVWIRAHQIYKLKKNENCVQNKCFLQLETSTLISCFRKLLKLMF